MSRRLESLPLTDEAHSHASAACQGSMADRQCVSVMDSWPFAEHVDQNVEERDQVAEPRALQWSYEQGKVTLFKKNSLSGSMTVCT